VGKGNRGKPVGWDNERKGRPKRPRARPFEKKKVLQNNQGERTQGNMRGGESGTKKSGHHWRQKEDPPVFGCVPKTDVKGGGGAQKKKGKGKARDT